MGLENGLAGRFYPLACLTLLGRHGTRTFAEAVAPALAILDRHEQPWHANLAKTLRRLVEAERAAAGDRQRGLRLVAERSQELWPDKQPA